MKDRIKQIMESQHMTQQEFASYIDIAPATLSSIFNGRTRPTLNIVEAIKKKISDINTDWLMFGTGDMYISSSLPSREGGSDQLEAQESMLDFSESDPLPIFADQQHHSEPVRGAVPTASSFDSVGSTRSKYARDEVKTIDIRKRSVTEIRVYYDDQTWESFVPSKK